MRQISFTLPLEENVVKALPPGTYQITMTGLVDNNDTVTVEPRNAADTGWNAVTTLNRADSGKIGSKTVVITASGKVRCQMNNEVQPTSVKVRLSA